MLKEAWRWLFALAVAGTGEKERKRGRQFKPYLSAAFSSAKSCYAIILRTYLFMVVRFTEISGSDRACGTKTYQGGICAILPESVHYQGVTEYILAVQLAGFSLCSSFYLYGQILLS